MYTRDLALATTLRLHDHEPVGLRMCDDGRNAEWIFKLDEHGQQLVRDYNDGMAEVEPKEYNLKLRATRERLFAFLNNNGVGPAKRRA
jgi:hypothetical protein